MTADSENVGDFEAQQLVAYLDNELGEAEARRVERRLAEDAEYRERLRQLQRSWDLLDYLPRADAGETFTRSTVEMVTVRASREMRRRAATGPFRGAAAAFWMAAALLAFVAAGAGYLLTSRLLSHAEEQLVRDLPVIENVDLYWYVDDIEFLRALEQSGVFAEDERFEGSRGAS